MLDVAHSQAAAPGPSELRAVGRRSPRRARPDGGRGSRRDWAGVAEAPAADPAPPAEAVAPAALGTVAGAPLRAEDLLVEWHGVAPRDVWFVVEKLVATRLTRAEAQRLKIRLAPELVELRVAEETRRVSKQVAEAGEDLSVDEFLRSRLGVEPDAYFRQMRVATIRQMLAERATRAWTLTNEWVRLRLIIVGSPAEIEEVQAQLAAGGDFAELARERSLDDTAERGGLVPFLVRQERSPLSSLAFLTEPGEVGGPIEVGEHQVLLRVEERHPALTGDWGALEETVEASLAEFPLSDAEFLHWKLTMEARYPIDIEPLEKLLGADPAGP